MCAGQTYSAYSWSRCNGQLVPMVISQSEKRGPRVDIPKLDGYCSLSEPRSLLLEGRDALPRGGNVFARTARFASPSEGFQVASRRRREEDMAGRRTVTRGC